MNRITKKTAFVLVGILAFSLVAGNALFAGGSNSSGLGLVHSGDEAFITSPFSAGTTSSGQSSNSSSDVITAEDAAFAKSSYNGALIAAGSSGRGSSQNVVNASDINFVRNGTIGSDAAYLVCVVDGAQVSGKVCVN
jgi:hypothetical protein